MQFNTKIMPVNIMSSMTVQYHLVYLTFIVFERVSKMGQRVKATFSITTEATVNELSVEGKLILTIALF